MAVEAVVSAVVGKLTSLLIEEVQLLRGVRHEVEWIKTELQGMQCFLKDADEKQGLNANVKNWVADLRDVAYEAEDIIDTLILRKEQKKNKNAIKRYAPIFCNLMTCRKVGNEIRGIRTKLREISERRSTYNIKSLGITEETSNNAMKRLQERRRSSPHSDESDVIALEDDLRTLKSRLLENDLNLRVISIVGMGGLGKTTLANKVYNNKDVANYFDCRVWINVSQVYSAKGLLEDIWKKVVNVSEFNLKQVNLTIEQMEERLLVELKEKRYLLVMDDVWDIDAWNSVKRAFPIMKNGSRVLLTTRKREVATQADKRSPPHEPKLLNDENSWALFLKKVGMEESECLPNLQELGKRIVKKCGGLPLAIVVLGGLLSSKEANYSTWSRLLKRVSWQLEQDQTNCSEILAMSYIDLPHYLKPCFIYVGLFPENYEINIRRLKGLWLAEGLVQPRDNEPLEDVAEDYIEELIDRSMIQVAEMKSDGNIKTCCMHDLLRDFALSKAKESNFFHIYGNMESKSTNEQSTSIENVNIRRLAAHHYVHKSQSSVHYPRSYLAFGSKSNVTIGESVSNFLYNGIQNKGFGLLRVLYIEGVREPKLPETLGQLIHLRYLGLRRTVSSILPSSLGNLRNLQTLDVKHSSINVFDCPIWKLQQMRHLYLNGGLYMSGNDNSKIRHPTKSGNNGSFRLINLQTLSGLYIDGKTWVEGGFDNSVQLRKLKVCGNLASQGKSLADWFAKLDRLEVLKLVAIDGAEHPYRLPTMMQFSNNKLLEALHIKGLFAKKLLEAHEFPPNLTILSLVACELEEDPFLTLEKLQNLRSLTLGYNSYNGKEMVCSSGGFQHLQELTVRRLDQLVSWKVEDGAMPILKMLKLSSCDQLMEIPQRLQDLITL